jgi:predicted phosphodiesterase
MRLGVIADIHGNLPALDAVRADLRRRGVERVVNLGDCVSGPLWPRETIERLEALGWTTLRGNHDRWVAEQAPETMGRSDRFAFTELTAAQRRWLGALPVVADLGDGIVAFHARPGDDNRYLVEDIAGGRLVRATPRTIAERLGALHCRIALCGHSHLPGLMELAGGPLIVNPGSVGCPAYDDPDVDPHVSEAGSPHARYAILSLEHERIDVELIALTYPWESAATRAEQNGRPDWAFALRVGFVA